MKPASRTIVLDSNLLLLLLVGSFEPRTLASFKRLSSFTAVDLRTVQAATLSRRLLVSPNLLTEVSNLANGLPELPRQGFHRYLAAVLPGTVEFYFESERLAQTPAFPLFGLGDAAVCALSKHGPVVTEDGRLRAYLRSVRRPAFSLAEIAFSPSLR